MAFFWSFVGRDTGAASETQQVDVASCGWRLYLNSFDRFSPKQMRLLAEWRALSIKSEIHYSARLWWMMDGGPHGTGASDMSFLQSIWSHQSWTVGFQYYCILTCSILACGSPSVHRDVAIWFLCCAMMKRSADEAFDEVITKESLVCWGISMLVAVESLSIWNCNIIL